MKLSKIRMRVRVVFFHLLSFPPWVLSWLVGFTKISIQEGYRSGKIKGIKMRRGYYICDDEEVTPIAIGNMTALEDSK